jgi:hypothetical protein
MTNRQATCFGDLDDAGKEQYVYGVIRFYRELAQMINEHAVWNPDQRTLYDEGFGFAAFTCSKALEEQFGLHEAFKK